MTEEKENNKDNDYESLRFLHTPIIIEPMECRVIHVREPIPPRKKKKRYKRIDFVLIGLYSLVVIIPALVIWVFFGPQLILELLPFVILGFLLGFFRS
jgi:hypothetical protein